MSDLRIQPLLPSDSRWWECRTVHDCRLMRKMCAPVRHVGLGPTDYRLLSAEVDACWKLP